MSWTQQMDTVMVGVQDMAAMTAFYRRALGLEPTYESPHWTAFDIGGVQLGLHAGGSGEAPGGGFVPSFRVEDIRAFLGHLQEMGADVEPDLHQTPRGPLLTFRDPEGHAWQAIQVG